MFRQLLVIGSIPYLNKPKTFGGTTILMENLLDYLNSSRIKFYFISANKINIRYF